MERYSARCVGTIGGAAVGGLVGVLGGSIYLCNSMGKMDGTFSDIKYSLATVVIMLVSTGLGSCIGPRVVKCLRGCCSKVPEGSMTNQLIRSNSPKCIAKGRELIEV